MSTELLTTPPEHIHCFWSQIHRNRTWRPRTGREPACIARKRCLEVCGGVSGDHKVRCRVLPGCLRSCCYDLLEIHHLGALALLLSASAERYQLIMGNLNFRGFSQILQNLSIYERVLNRTDGRYIETRVVLCPLGLDLLNRTGPALRAGPQNPTLTPRAQRKSASGAPRRQYNLMTSPQTVFP